MSRLFYDPPRVPSAQSGGKGKSVTLSNRQYAEKVASLIPGEVIATYLAIMRYIPNIRFINLHNYFYWGSFIAGVGGTFFYMRWVADAGKPRGMQVFLSIVAFVFWAYATTGDKVCPAIYDYAIGSIGLILFTFFSGKIPLN